LIKKSSVNTSIKLKGLILTAEAPGKDRLSFPYYETVLFKYNYLILVTGFL